MPQKYLSATLSAFLFCGLLTAAQQDPNPYARNLVTEPYAPKHAMYRDGWIDFNKNGKQDIYEDPTASIEARVEDLLSQMNIDEKTCQMATLYGYRRVLRDDLPTPGWKKKIWKDGIGAIDEHLNACYSQGAWPKYNPNQWPASRHAWAINEVQRFFVEETRLGIPADMTNEGLRGVEAYRATCFPSALGMGHTWNPELIGNVGEITGKEARALGFTNIYAPVLDVLRDQRWGRCEEVYGESPYLVAEMGIQMAKGLQKNMQVASTGKHFVAFGNNKGARENFGRADPQMSPRELESIHAYTFARVIREAGMLGVMSSLNDYDGQPIQSSYYWLTQRLRDDMGLRGYVVSDSNAVENLKNKFATAHNDKETVRQAVLAGLNVRCTFKSPDTYILPLRELVAEGTVPMSIIDSRVRDVLRVKFMVGLFDNPYNRTPADADKIVENPAHLAVADQVSHESIVLLKNDKNTLPLDIPKLKTVTVCGPNATEKWLALNRYGPHAVPVTTVLDGVREALKGKAEVLYTKGCDIADRHFPDSEIYDYPIEPAEQKAIDAAVAMAKRSDAVIAVMGENLRTGGENKTRTDIRLTGRQEELLKALKATGKPVIMVLINGRPLSSVWADRNLPAIIEAWQPGAQGGTAVADVLFGKYNPGGKLTVTIPKSVGQIPLHFPTRHGGQAPGPISVNGPLYPFGHGLSYTTFKYGTLKIDRTTIAPGEDIHARVTVTNTGKRAGDEVVQLYISDRYASLNQHIRRLAGFKRIHLKPGESKKVTFTIGRDRMQMIDAFWNWTVEAGAFVLEAGTSSEKILSTATFTVEGEDPAPVAIPRPQPAKTVPAHTTRLPVKKQTEAVNPEAAHPARDGNAKTV